MMSGELDGLDSRGPWASVTLTECSAGRGWFAYRSIGLTRWATRETAQRYVRRQAGWRRAAVIAWGDDLLTDGQVWSGAPELVTNPRVVVALALAHEPQFESDPKLFELPSGRFLGCACGKTLAEPIPWAVEGERWYAKHDIEVFPQGFPEGHKRWS
jgi:hypothetical protein